MINYLNLLQNILSHGTPKPDRTGTGTRSLFAERLTFDLEQGFPALTTKKLWCRGVVCELQWFMSGSTNCNDLPEDVRKWWEPWSAADGSLGPIYGEQLRKQTSHDSSNSTFFSVSEADQLQDVITSLREDPHGRRHVITLWNSAAMKHARLPCCHGTVIQFYVRNDKLFCFMHQRSADVFLGLPVNCASYALLTHIVAKESGLGVGELTISLGDSHLYENHLDQAKQQLLRSPRKLPEIVLPKCSGLDEWIKADPMSFVLHGYDPYPTIKADIAV
jgi:thymidylate synthase